MSGTKPWVASLNISEQQWTSWKSQVAEGESITFWALKNNHLDQQAYLIWARDHYQLPSLNNDFFNLEPDREFFSQISSVANWSEKLIPLRQWDNTVYVAVVEPIPDLKWSFPVQYILAPAEGLSRYWQCLQDSNLQMSTFPELTESASSNSLAQQIPPTIDTPTTIPDPTPDAVESLPQQPDGFNFSFETSAPVSSEPAIEGLHLSLPTPDQAPSDSLELQMEGLNLQLPTESSSVDSQPASTTETIATSPSNEMMEGLSGLNLNLNAVPDEMTNLSQAQPETSSAIDNDALTGLNLQITKLDVMQEQPLMAEQISMPSHQSFNEQDLVLSAEKQFASTYHSFILLRNETTQLRPVELKGRWQAPEDAITVDLSLPSLFRIVTRTKLPFHGPVSGSAVNDQFFMQYKVTPKFVTACPIIRDEQVAYVFLLVSDEIKDSLRTLSAVEKFCIQAAGQLAELKAAS